MRAKPALTAGVIHVYYVNVMRSKAPHNGRGYSPLQYFNVNAMRSKAPHSGRGYPPLQPPKATPSGEIFCPLKSQSFILYTKP